MDYLHSADGAGYLSCGREMSMVFWMMASRNVYWRTTMVGLPVLTETRTYCPLREHQNQQRVPVVALARPSTIEQEGGDAQRPVMQRLSRIFNGYQWSGIRSVWTSGKY